MQPCWAYKCRGLEKRAFLGKYGIGQTPDANDKYGLEESRLLSYGKYGHLPIFPSETACYFVVKFTHHSFSILITNIALLRSW
jgi:hypothetical protein